MVQSCIIRGCSNTYGMRKALKLHRFPKNVRMRELWMQAINRDDEIKDYWRICSDHFLLSDYESEKLRKGAVPTVFTVKKCLDCNPNVQNLNFEQVNVSSGVKQVQIKDEPNMECVPDITLQDDPLFCEQHQENKDKIIEESVTGGVPEVVLPDSYLSCNQRQENELQSVSNPHVIPTCISLGTQTSPLHEERESLEKNKLKRKIRNLQRTLNRRNKTIETYRRNKECKIRFDRIRYLLKDLQGKSSQHGNVLQLLQSLIKK